MQNYDQVTINSSWHASDLDYFESGSEFRILSVHKDVINLVSDKHSRLLIIAVEGPVKGPSTIGLVNTDFLTLSKLISKNTCFCLDEQKYSINDNTSKITINISGGEKISFYVADYSKTKPAISREKYLYCKELLKKWPFPSASSVMLDIPGGEDYFRNEIYVNYPRLVHSLIELDEEEFINRCRKIIGMGRGLTPTGDDLIHGTLVTFRYFSPYFKFKNRTYEELLNLCNKTTRHGRHMIELSYHGLTLQPFIELLKDLAAVKEPGENMHGLFNIGSSTGYDLAVAAIYSAGQISK